MKSIDSYQNKMQFNIQTMQCNDKHKICKLQLLTRRERLTVHQAKEDCSRNISGRTHSKVSQSFRDEGRTATTTVARLLIAGGLASHSLWSLLDSVNSGRIVQRSLTVFRGFDVRARAQFVDVDHKRPRVGRPSQFVVQQSASFFHSKWASDIDT